MDKCRSMLPGKRAGRNSLQRPSQVMIDKVLTVKRDKVDMMDDLPTLSNVG
jgi:hypothetical protein